MGIPNPPFMWDICPGISHSECSHFPARHHRYSSTEKLECVLRSRIQGHKTAPHLATQNELSPVTSLYSSCGISGDMAPESSVSATSSSIFSELSRTEFLDDYYRILNISKYAATSTQLCIDAEPVFQQYRTAYLEGRQWVFTDHTNYQPTILAFAQRQEGMAYQVLQGAHRLAPSRKVLSVRSSTNKLKSDVHRTVEHNVFTEVAKRKRCPTFRASFKSPSRRSSDCELLNKI